MIDSVLNKNGQCLDEKKHEVKERSSPSFGVLIEDSELPDSFS